MYLITCLILVRQFRVSLLNLVHLDHTCTHVAGIYLILQLPKIVLNSLCSLLQGDIPASSRNIWDSGWEFVSRQPDSLNGYMTVYTSRLL